MFLADVLAVDGELLLESPVLVSEIGVGVLQLLDVESLVIFSLLVIPQSIVLKLKLFELGILLVQLLLCLLC